MKRLIFCAILAVFVWGGFGATLGRSPVNIQIRAHSQVCPQFSLYLPCLPDDEPFSKGHGATPLLPSPGIFALILKPSWNNSPPSNGSNLPFQKYCPYLKLACGGIAA
jgi:hypothetical protein